MSTFEKGLQMTLDEFAAKVSWEGGIFAAIDYGLKSSHLSPEVRDANPELVLAWDKAVASYEAMRSVEKFFPNL